MLAIRSSIKLLRSTNTVHARVLSTAILENYRPKWPKLDFRSTETVPEIPARTVPDDKLRFVMSATMERGASIFFPHLHHHPADLKVRLLVKIDDLGLTKEEQRVMIALVGPRFNPGKREIKLTENKYPNRLENKKYLIYTLERLVAEARKLNAEKDKYM